MALLETWRNLAYGDGLDDKKREELWSGYITSGGLPNSKLSKLVITVS